MDKKSKNKNQNQKEVKNVPIYLPHVALSLTSSASSVLLVSNILTVILKSPNISLLYLFSSLSAINLNSFSFPVPLLQIVQYKLYNLLRIL